MTRYMYKHLCEMGERIAQMRPKHWVIFGVATPSPIKIMPCLWALSIIILDVFLEKARQGTEQDHARRRQRSQAHARLLR